MENRKIQSGRRYFWSFVIATVLFVLVIYSSYFFSYVELKRVSNLQEDVAYEIFEDKLDYTLFEKNVCGGEVFEEVSKDLNFQGRIIDDLEKKFGKNNEDVLFQKKFYTLVELEHLEFINILNDQCDLGMATILFFYSNEEKGIEQSEEVGRLLNTVYARNSDSLLIYSFDVNLDSNLISKLKLKYDISESPVIVVNEKIKIFNPQNLEEI